MENAVVLNNKTDIHRAKMLMLSLISSGIARSCYLTASLVSRTRLEALRRELASQQAAIQSQLGLHIPVYDNCTLVNYNILETVR